MQKNYTFKFTSSAALEALKAGKYDPIDFYEARLDLFNLSVMADYDQLVCLPTLTAIDKYWYQIETARKVLRQLGGRALLADEVGLGKTIEAGLIIAEYLARGTFDHQKRMLSHHPNKQQMGSVHENSLPQLKPWNKFHPEYTNPPPKLNAQRTFLELPQPSALNLN
jgi:SNF2 family DNA or RNA helicase